MSLGVKLAIAGIALAAAAGLGYAIVSAYNGALADAATWEARAGQAQLAAEGWEAAAAFWRQEKDRADQAIAARDRRVGLVEQERAKLHADLQEAKRRDPDLQAWADAPLPGFVVEQLRSLAAEPGSAPRREDRPAGEPHRGNAGSRLARHDER